MIPVLQNRWKIQGRRLVYYGLRSAPHTFRGGVRVGRRALKLLRMLDGKRSKEELPEFRALSRLIRKGVVVDVSLYRKSPESFAEARFCARCAANDYTLPGLEFDENGLCPICQHPEFRRYRSVLPELSGIPRAKRGQFDAAVFYTGGKDSSYLLYELAKVRNLRILALTWEIPFCSAAARENMRRAKQRLPQVTFLSRAADPQALRKVYARLYGLQGNVCACPSMAYVLFFPLLAELRVPYLVLGNEPAQMYSLLFNRMAPRIAYRMTGSRLVNFAVNLGRLATFQKPLRRGQLQMLLTVKQLAGCRLPLKKLAGYRNELVENVTEALSRAPELTGELCGAIRKYARSGRFPALVHIGLDRLEEGGSYPWDSVRGLLERELGWQGAPSGRGLHTSCDLEGCKEYTQLAGFREMRTRTLPFSALELAIASSTGSLTREQAIAELEKSGFCAPPPQLARMSEEARLF